MSLLMIALAAAAGAESCDLVRREQGEFNARMFPRMERITRAAQRPDGTQRPLTVAERAESAAIEAEVESFIARFNVRLRNCRDS